MWDDERAPGLVLRSLTTAISFLGVLFFAFALTSALVYLAELCEQNITMAKRIIQYTIGVVIGCTLLLLVDGISWWRCLLSVALKLPYIKLLPKFPWINMWSAAFALCAVCCLADNAMWYMYFKNDQEAPLLQYWSVISFFSFMCWLLPLEFFVSASLYDDDLPSVFKRDE